MIVLLGTLVVLVTVFLLVSVLAAACGNVVVGVVIVGVVNVGVVVVVGSVAVGVDGMAVREAEMRGANLQLPGVRSCSLGPPNLHFGHDQNVD